MKKYNTTLEFVLALVPTFFMLLTTIIFVLFSLQVWLGFSIANMDTILLDNVAQNITQTILMTITISGCLLFITFDVLLLKAAFAIKNRKWHWGIALIIIGLLFIITIELPIVTIGLLLIASGTISIIKGNK